MYLLLIIYYYQSLLWSIPGLMAIARQRVSVRASVRLCVQDLSPIFGTKIQMSG